ncbi:Transmembrane protease serine 5, partial [Armadillidium nasatum]
ITETVSHPLYDPATVDNDVALLRLPEPIHLGDKIFPACVPDQGSSLPVGSQCTIIGWGKERNNHFFGTDVLNEAELQYIISILLVILYRYYQLYYINIIDIIIISILSHCME